MSSARRNEPQGYSLTINTATNDGEMSLCPHTNVPRIRTETPGSPDSLLGPTTSAILRDGTTVTKRP